MKTHLTATALSMAAIAAQPAQAQTAPLEGVGDWQVTRSAESCSLQRTFGSGESEKTFTFYSYGPDESYRITLTGPGVPRDVGRARVSRIGFGSAAELQEIITINSRSGENGMLSFHLTGHGAAFRYYRGWEVRGGAEGPEREMMWPDDLSQVTIENSGLGRVTLNLGSMTFAFNELARCKAALAAGWGWDYAAIDQIGTPPRLKTPGPTVDLMGMPPALVVNHISMIAQLRINVDEQGRGADCVVQSPPLEARAQRDLCRPFVGGTPFEPARDDAGNAVPGLFRLHYTYFIFD